MIEEKQKTWATADRKNNREHPAKATAKQVTAGDMNVMIQTEEPTETQQKKEATAFKKKCCCGSTLHNFYFSSKLAYAASSNCRISAVILNPSPPKLLL